MLLKYKHDGNVALTEVGDVNFDFINGCVEFKPLDNTLLSLRLRNATSFIADKIGKDLFDDGKADITHFGEVELFNSDEGSEEYGYELG